ncbi:MAG TPA: PEP-CTERM sorting domain-containing protein [Bryobacteraceae bacterium]|nr:PEP-CTERM sorting domain-containing protein [Bryobacteraceae bacterium]
MKAQKALWLPRLAIAGLGAMLIPVSGFANYLEGGTYQVITTNAPDDSTQTLTLNNTTQPVDQGNLTVQTTVLPDMSDPNSQWIDFDFQVAAGSVLARNPDGFWEIQVNDIPLSSPGFFTGFAAYWTINEVAATNIKPITGYPAPGPNPVNPSLGEAYSSTFPPSGAPENYIDVYAYVAPFATQLAQAGMDPNAVNGFHLDALVTNAATSAVPEPSTFALGSLAVFGLLLVAGRRRRAAN